MWFKVEGQRVYHHANDKNWYTYCGVSMRDHPIVAYYATPAREDCCGKCWRRVHPDSPPIKRSKKV